MLAGSAENKTSESAIMLSPSGYFSINLARRRFMAAPLSA